MDVDKIEQVEKLKEFYANGDSNLTERELVRLQAEAYGIDREQSQSLFNIQMTPAHFSLVTTLNGKKVGVNYWNPDHYNEINGDPMAFEKLLQTHEVYGENESGKIGIVYPLS